MKKQLITAGLVLAMSVSSIACGSNGDADVTTNERTTEAVKDKT